MFTVGGVVFTVGEAEFKVGGAVFTVVGAVFTVGGAPKQEEEHLNMAVGPLKWYWGQFFWGGHSYFIGVSNDLSKNNGT